MGRITKLLNRIFAFLVVLVFISFAKGKKQEENIEPSHLVTGIMINAILQDSAFKKYLHLESIDRTPILIIDTLLDTSVSATRFQNPVRVTALTSSDIHSAIRIISIKETGKLATIKFDYDIEGARATYVLVETKDKILKVKSRKIVER